MLIQGCEYENYWLAPTWFLVQVNVCIIWYSQWFPVGDNVNKYCIVNGDQNKSEITIASLNVRGLADKLKRMDVFKWLRDKKYNLYCLQDCHFSEENDFIYRSEWGYKCVISSHTTVSRGVVILFNNNFDFSVHQEYSDP